MGSKPRKKLPFMSPSQQLLIITSRKAQYERRFKKWGFQKNRKKDIWEVVAFKVRKRKRSDKESEVWIGDERVPAKKLMKEVSRYGYGFQGNHHIPKCPSADIKYLHLRSINSKDT
jgi:hypothetical protein